MESDTLPGHFMFQTLQQLLLQRKQLQNAVDIALAIKGRISVVTEESQRVDHAVIKSCMTCTVKKNPPGI